MYLVLCIRFHLHIEIIRIDKNISRTLKYVRLLKNVSDGLGILPVISPERRKATEFISAGFDARYSYLI